jgi:acetoin utilization protein AcuB
MTTTTTSPAVRGGDRPLVRLRASDVMTCDVATVVTTTTVGEAMTLMRTLGIRHLPVLGDGRFVGIVDDRLVTFALLTSDGFGGVLEQPVSTAMTHYVPQVAPGEPLQRVAHLLRTSRCDALVVIDAQDHLLGIITMVDVVTAVALGSTGSDASTTTGVRS